MVKSCAVFKSVYHPTSLGFRTCLKYAALTQRYTKICQKPQQWVLRDWAKPVTTENDNKSL